MARATYTVVKPIAVINGQTAGDWRIFNNTFFNDFMLRNFLSFY